jgi:YesN/AraC family two-component response regulator
MSQSLRVIVADDEPEILRYYHAIVVQLGHTVLAEAHNGHEIVEQCRRFEPDLVISDIAMPELDGITALERLDTRSKTLFIFVTGCDDAAIRQRAQHQHVLAYLLKPIKKADLAAALCRVTGHEET